jgi:hypothetical protein
MLTLIILTKMNRSTYLRVSLLALILIIAILDMLFEKWQCLFLRRRLQLRRSCLFKFWGQRFLKIKILMNISCVNVDNIVVIHLTLSQVLFSKVHLVLSTRSIWEEVIHLQKHWVNLHLRSFYDLVCNSFLHQIHLTLTDNLHELVWKRDYHLGLLLLPLETWTICL